MATIGGGGSGGGAQARVADQSFNTLARPRQWISLQRRRDGVLPGGGFGLCGVHLASLSLSARSGPLRRIWSESAVLRWMSR